MKYASLVAVIVAAALFAAATGDVAEADHGPTLVPEPHPTGWTLVRYHPESPADGVDVLVAAVPDGAVSLHGTLDGEYVTYIPGAPAFVNEPFMDAFGAVDIWGWAFLVKMP